MTEKWAVMKLHGWSGLQALGLPLQAPAQGPQWFIPVFDTREQAVAWNADSEVNVAQIIIGEGGR